MTTTYATLARTSDDPVDHLTPEGIDHFDVVNLNSPAFPIFSGRITKLLESAQWNSVLVPA